MKDLDTLSYHPTAERITQTLCQKTQSDNARFYRSLVTYYLCKIASMMRTSIQYPGRKSPVPVNAFVLSLSPSGSGKGLSMGIIEDQVINQFKHVFMRETYPLIAEQNLRSMSVDRASRKGTDPDQEFEEVCAEFKATGRMRFAFSEATSPAVKQMRDMLIMANCGAVNLEIDEIGSNLLGQKEVIDVFLELFDGKTKDKLIKNTKEQSRTEELEGVTPTNCLLFGEPVKLLDGAKLEAELMSMLETGYARRCFFGYSNELDEVSDLTPEQIYDMMVDDSSDEFLDELSDRLGVLANPVNFGKTLVMSKDVAILSIAYRQHCRKIAAALPAHASVLKKEISNRFFKALKLAGAYAFLDGHHEITADNFYHAMKMAEESGKDFKALMTREKSHVKLAKYIADVKEMVTRADLSDHLPFFKGSTGFKTELITLATEWGYKNNILIKKSYLDGIEMLSADSLEKTDLNNMLLSYSDDIAYNYLNQKAPWDKIHRLTQHTGLHWCAHHLRNGHRKDDNVIPGFNMVVVDVDGGVSLDTARFLLREYKCMFYTTKRHTDAENRFRILIPMNYVLELDSTDYKEFMQNVYEWLPFDVDDGTCDRPRKWMSNDGKYHYNEGELLDVLPFIPKTSKNEERKRERKELDAANVTRLDAWFRNNTGSGNRNHQMIKYALMFVDAGKTYVEVLDQVQNLNQQLSGPLSDDEIMQTIMQTVGRKIQERDGEAA